MTYFRKHSQIVLFHSRRSLSSLQMYQPRSPLRMFWELSGIAITYSSSQPALQSFLLVYIQIQNTLIQ